MLGRVKQLITFLPTLLIATLSVFFVAAQAQAVENTGSISVCKIVVDQNNNIVTGSDRPGASFSISGFTPSPETSQGPAAGVLPTSTFTTPLTLNSHILANTQGNDSQCFTYDNLQFGNYYWSTENNPASGWDTPFYSDQYTGPANSVVNLFSYDGSLFDADQANDSSRNLDADGHIVLTAERPTRILIIANRYHAPDNQPTVTPTPTNSSGNNGGSGVTFTCNDTAPSSAPVITSIVAGQNSVTLNWKEAGDPVSYYYIKYGTQPGKYIYGNINIGGKGTTTYTINGLSGGTTYYFVVGAGNGCKPGPYSSEVSGTPSGEQVNSIPEGFAPITNEVLSTSSSDEVKGSSATDTKGTFCAGCIWFPILLGEIIALILFYGITRKSTVGTKRKYIFGALIGVIAYIIFLIINRNCSAGVMNFVLFTIPCVYFWAVDGVVFAIISLIMRRPSSIK